MMGAQPISIAATYHLLPFLGSCPVGPLRTYVAPAIAEIPAETNQMSTNNTNIGDKWSIICPASKPAQ